MRLDLAQTWQEASGMLRANAEAVSGLAGMFILLPGIVSAWLLPDRPPIAKDATFADIVNANSAYMLANWPILVGNALVLAFGTLAILALLLDRRRPTVREALRIGLVALPGYLAANILQSLAVVLGLFALIVPGLYLAARFLCIAPVAAAEGAANPLRIIERSLAVTRGNGWRIMALVAVVFMVWIVLSTAIVSTVGIVGELLLPGDVARLLSIVAGALVETALGLAFLGISAAIYRQGSVSA